jgi:DNA polymerase elongation subunit (family B)
MVTLLLTNSSPLAALRVTGPFESKSENAQLLTNTVLQGATRRLGRHVRHIRELDEDGVLMLPAEEQYLVATGRCYFRDLSFDQLHRLQFDLETTGLDPAHDRIFMVSVRGPNGASEVLEAHGADDDAEADLIRRLVATIRAADPDVIENHNLHGFDLPSLDRRAHRLRVPLALGRIGPPGLGSARRDAGSRPAMATRVVACGSSRPDAS